MIINFEEEVMTLHSELQNEVIELRTQLMGSLLTDRMELKDKLVRQGLIGLGWTPPWNYNMEEAPKDGTLLFLKEKREWWGEGGQPIIGSWRVDEGYSGDKEPLWLDDSYDEWSTGYESVPLNPVAWKPIVD